MLIRRVGWCADAWCRRQRMVERGSSAYREQARRLGWGVVGALLCALGCVASPADTTGVRWAPPARTSPPPSPLVPPLPPREAPPQVPGRVSTAPEGLRFVGREAAAAWPEDGRETLLTFVQLSDTHVGRGRDLRAFEESVAAINRLEPQPAFVIITGDLTDTFSPREVLAFKGALAALRAPVWVVPGNHDEGFDPSDRSIRFFNKHFPEYVTPYAFDAGPLTLVGVDSQLFNARRRSPVSSAFADAQWSKLEEVLASAQQRGRRIVLFHHIPFYPSWEPHKGVRRMWDDARREAWRGLLARYGVEAELTGHFHRDELYAEGQTLLLNAPPISEKFGRRPSLRLFRVTAEGLTLRQVYFRSEDAGWSYEVDLHRVDEGRLDAWTLGLDTSELREHWLRRQTGSAGAAAWFERMDRERWRRHLVEPLEEADAKKGLAQRRRIR